MTSRRDCRVGQPATESGFMAGRDFFGRASSLGLCWGYGGVIVELSSGYSGVIVGLQWDNAK